MQQIERYGVIALVFLLVTIVAVSFWGDSKSPGFWSRLTGRGAKKDVAAAQVQANPEIAAQPTETAPLAAAPAPGATGERALQTELPLSAASTPVSADLGTGTTTAAPAPAVSAPVPAPAFSAPVASSTPPPSKPALRIVQAAAPAGSVEYTVQKGDSLMRIASRTLGAKDRWTEIRDLNHGVDPRSLRVGMKLAIPASASARHTGAETKSVVPVKKAATAPAPQKKVATGASDTYLVHKGDTLKSIAERRLGNSARWKEIAAANPKIDPNHLVAGASIRVPGGKAAPRSESKGEPALAAAMPRETHRDLASSRPHVR